MDRFTELETFVGVAKEGGFNAASRRLNKSPPTITRLIASLEKRIGTRLFSRTTRSIALTEAGERLLKDATKILEDLTAAEASAAGAHLDPQGRLTVTAPVIFGRQYIAPILRSFLEMHPNVSARTIFVDRVVNLIEEGIDVAVRIGDLPDSSLMAIRVGHVRRVVVASPDYIEKHGNPEVPDDLGSHRIASWVSAGDVQTWEFEREGIQRRGDLRPEFQGTMIDTLIDAAVAGWAISRVFSYQVADHLREGRLIEVASGFEDRLVPVHLVHAEGQLRAAKIRAFVDTAAKELRKSSTDWVT